MLVVAKAPVAGLVKTRLGRVIGMEQAAVLAAAALLDTLAVCAAAYGVSRCHLALDGDLSRAVHHEEIEVAVDGWTVHRQRGDGFAERLVNAHADVGSTTLTPVVQVGMDTPHLAASTLLDVGDQLTHRDSAVLGPALDGGWWLLGVGGPHLVRHLGGVVMSTISTGAMTRRALQRAGARVSEVEALRDVDELEDAERVAAASPMTRFARAFSTGTT
jgi:uncharacterized protein